MTDNLSILRKVLQPRPVSLGDPPWSRDTLIKSYFANSAETRRLVESRPGAAFQVHLDSLSLSLDLFNDSINDLLRSIDEFRKASLAPGFHSRVRQSEFERLQLSVRRAMFSASAAAMALVEHTRTVNNALNVPDYQDRVDASFSSSMSHRFIQDLRNCVLHFRLLPADWQTTIAANKGESTRFYIRKETLLGWREWSPPVRAFIQDLDYGIEIEELFRSYARTVNDFHQWYRLAIDELGRVELVEYRSYDRILKGIAWRSSYRLILQLARSAGVNPFDYLSEYLFPDELEVVLQIKDREAQVDKIIEILDIYDACDEALRTEAYQVFGVPPNKGGAS
jgi:hypothetical protein